MIGSIGDVTFETSSQRIRTLFDMKRTGAVRLAQHERMNEKAITEFVGKGLESISFSMHLAGYLGVNPDKEAERLREYRDNGTPLLFVLNNKVVGENKWLIESISEEVERFGRDGEILSMNVELSLSEYVERIQHV
ncbi:MAG: phage tail protein [Negativicoccus succinicivorans]|uniref:phage tail protein n=1 Tax=Negativicoccus succinicivorans TaxID=620903 RepID=UPI002353D34F|nr:phage tail protein [Negativicoccus succinicivorans]MBS5890602.1 phage tail protein [Negativicoccus succinicivorans]MDU5395749.1 phage tail protein [Negativicoccus succinicivorans]